MNRQLFQLNQRQLAWVAAVLLVIGSLCQMACNQEIVKAASSFTLDIYWDFSIEWPEDEARRRLIEQIIETLKRNPYIIKVRVIELGTARKASESFSHDFDLGAFAAVPVATIAPELYGNVQEQNRVANAAKEAQQKALDERSQRIQPKLEELRAHLLRLTTNLTRCTSFVELTARLQADQPTHALIVTDGRANCMGEAATYQAAAEQRLVVIQCPTVEGRTAERRETLQKMLPKALIFLLPQMTSALATLGPKEALPSSLKKL